MKRRDFITTAMGAGVAAAWPIALRAQSFPARSITLIVPFAAGGPTDVLARILAEHMRSTLGQTVLIENVTGASGAIAGQRAARAAPDGYTLTIGHWGTHVLNGAVYTLQYDVLNDFEPVALVGNGPQLIIGRPKLPAKDLRELIDWLKGNKASAGTAGPGSGAHVAGVFFQNLTGTGFTFVPYRGAGPALNDLLPGRVDVMFNNIGAVLPLIQAGKLRGLAVTMAKRSPAIPGLPPIAEEGVPGFDVSSWYALFAPARTPAEIIRKMHGDIVLALTDPTIKNRLEQLGVVVVGSTPEALGAFLKSEMEKWGPVIKDAGITAQE
jgi:tripartite-type tricarboxylate transporter receptor subunit TctC